MENTEIKQSAPVSTPSKETTKPKATVKPKAAATQSTTPTFTAPKKKRKWVKRLITLVILAVFIALVVTQCMKGGGIVASGGYLSEQVTRQDLIVSVSGTGTIEPNNSYKVTTLVKGEVLEAPFEEGDTIQKGALLFRIDSKDVESRIQQARLSLENARISYNQLLKNQADAKKNGTVKATAAGVITALYVDQGDMVNAGTVIADILDRDNMKLVVPFHTTDILGFYLGQPAVLTINGTMETISGTIDSIAATDDVGPGGTLVRQITLLVKNPGALSNTSSGTAAVGAVSCASSATFEYASEKQVIARTSGELKSLTAKEGDAVYKDQVIGQFDATDIASQLESAQIAIENAQLTLNNAQDQLKDYSITSTIAGKVIEKNVNVGDNIDGTSTTAGSAVSPAIIYDLTALTFDMKIDELDISKVKVGQEVEITADALDGKRFVGHVDTVNINGTTLNGVTTYPVTILVDSPDELLPGMNVSAKVIVEDIGNVLCIPVNAVSRANGGTVMFPGPGALDDKGNVVNPAAIEMRAITLGRNSAEFIEVLDGLSEGDVVLIENKASSAMAMMTGG